MSIGMVIALIKKLATTPDPAVIEAAVSDWLDEHPEAACPIDDTAGEGDTDKVLSADKVTELVNAVLEAIVPLTPAATSGDVGKFLKAKTVSGGKVTEYEFASAGGGGSVDLFYVTPEDYGAVGDGTTDDSQAVQDACDAGYAVYFASNKTYYLASPVTIHHDCHLFGGKDTVIKTATPSGGTVNDAFVISGTLKDTVALTGDYTTIGDTNNSGNQFTFDDMTNVEIGDILVITAEDQYYSLARQMYYLGATLLVSDKYNGHIYTSNSMPWDIDNTEDVSVKVYSAPTVVIENLDFVSDLTSRGTGKWCVQIVNCKNSVIRNCNMTTMDNGVFINQSVNTLVEDVTVSKSKYDNTLSGDGYGIYIGSCSNTVIKRVLAICSQGCIDLGGTIPNIDTFVKECNISSECRAIGIDMHENSYNIVIEDSTLGGASLYGTATVNRCRFIKNNRVPTMTNAIVFRGSHDERWANLKVKDCVFDGTMGIQLDAPATQSPISSFNNVIGRVLIENCEGGEIIFNPSTSSTILSNTINEMVFDSWKNCRRFYRTAGNRIVHLVINNSTFKQNLWMTDNVASHGIYTTGIDQFDFSSEVPQTHRITVDKDTNAEVFSMAKNAPVVFSSNNQSAKFICCGRNFVSNNADDYVVGTVTGNQGGNLTRSAAAFSNPPEVSFDENGDLLFTQKSNTSSAMFFPFYLVYAKEYGKVKLSATLKNVGQTDGAAFYPYLAIVNCKTGKVEYRGNGTKKTATAEGVEITHEWDVDPDRVFMYFFSCTTPVNSSVSKFENLKCIFVPAFNTSVDLDEEFTAVRRTGDGTLASLEGVNNIMSSEFNFHVNLKADKLA